MDRKTYHWCVVPQCTNTSITTPEKEFIVIPSKAEIRRKWLQLARRDDALQISTNSPIFFCEDHFDLPNDMENYMEYHIMGFVKKIRMRPGCMPSKFDCQPDRKRRLSTSTSTFRSAAIKRQRKDLIKEAESSAQILMTQKESTITESEDKTIQDSSSISEMVKKRHLKKNVIRSKKLPVTHYDKHPTPEQQLRMSDRSNHSKEFKPLTHRICVKNFAKEEFFERRNKQYLYLKSGGIPSHMPRRLHSVTANTEKAPTKNNEMLVIKAEKIDEHDDSTNEESAFHPTEESVFYPSKDKDFHPIEESAVHPIVFVDVMRSSTPINNCASTMQHSEKKTNDVLPNTLTSSEPKRFPRYLRDIHTTDCGSSREAKMILKIAQRDMNRFRRKMDNLRSQISRLRKENKSFRATILKMRKKIN